MHLHWHIYSLYKFTIFLSNFIQNVASYSMFGVPLFRIGWLVLGLCSSVSPGTWDYRLDTLRRCLSKGFYSVFTRVLEKTTRNLETATRSSMTGNLNCHLPSINFCTEPLNHWSDLLFREKKLWHAGYQTTKSSPYRVCYHKNLDVRRRKKQE